MKDRATHWIQGFADPFKNTQATKMAFKRFLGPGTEPKHVYADNSGEIKKACEELGFVHDTSVLHRPQTKGVIER